jgi:glycosyltransferase involved in cell wall biosynthesis
MATKNGAPYLREQVDSILQQLSQEDELIISDDHSTDNTTTIIESYQDSRIRLIQAAKTQGIIKNFEAALQVSKGDLIFLADQDDVWKEGKVRIMMKYLDHNDLVISDCLVTDDSLNPKEESFFQMNNSRSGLLRNILKNSYMGCCMAFNRKVLNKALPFPAGIPMHDYWIGLIGELNYKVQFIPDLLLVHRRHSANASTTGAGSNRKITARIASRYRIVKHLFLRKSYAA